ncbi:putative baseplate assembly protein [Candidatus Uabimicrobium amorphum]|uniref:Putative baseplate assembly protein n=2 Tax=Uabimicrobium amorphum TaxID=2596890 RepID=A0A5S9IU53_UABAM|nr:putative baseplate assembly protein [Candidatus Uabimicrobium amorphum]
MHFHLDHRTAEDIFKHTVELAREYCPEWTKDWPENVNEINTKDFRVVVLKLFSELSETIIEQLNILPYKYLVAFLDLMGVYPLPAEPAKVPLSFTIAEGATSTYVPFRTQVASSENGDVIFETQEGLSVFHTPLQQIVSLNPWFGQFTNHPLILEEQQQGFYIFGKDDKEQYIPHKMYLGDSMIFSSEKPVDIKIKIIGSAKNFLPYFSIWKDSTGKVYEPKNKVGEEEFELTFEGIGPLEKSVVNGIEDYWLSVEPDFTEVKISEEVILPKISRVSADLKVSNLLLDSAIANDSSVEIEKGFYPFGETPKKLDTCYIASHNFAKTGAQISMNINLQEDLPHINPTSYTVAKSDIKDLFLLKRRLISNSRISKHLQTKFSAELKGEIDKAEEPDQVSEKVLEALNAMIDSEGLLYDKKAFKDVVLREEARYYVYSSDVEERDVKHINRLLLEDIFHTELQKHVEVELSWEYWNGERWLSLEEKETVDKEKDPKDEREVEDEFEVADKREVEDEEDAREDENEVEDEFLAVEKSKKAKSFEFQDDTQGLTKSGRITFVCPAMKSVEINGVKHYWIRARISSGTYGIPGKYLKTRNILEILDGWDDIANILIKEGITGGVRYQTPEYTPPFIENVVMDITFREKEFSHIQSHSNFEYFIHDQQKTFYPYRPVIGENPSLYFGFNKNVGGIAYTLYFAMREIYNDKDIRTLVKSTSKKNGIASAAVTWKYFDGTTWKTLEVENGDSFFGSGEITKFFIPKNIQPMHKFGKSLYWIKVEIEGDKVVSPSLKGIHFNSVWAKNSVTITNEILGSSNHTPNLKFQLTQTPILKNQQLIVHESKLVPNEERELLFAEEGQDAIFTKEGKTWVRWHEVLDFSGSTPFSRHYTLNRQDGTITFGDGLKGMIPSAGKDNIVAKIYSSGGGRSGNVSIGTVSSLTINIANIDSVNNYAVALGGNDQESLDDAVKRGPQTIKSKDRVVTKEDYEWLALMASQEVAKAKYIDSNRGEVTIAIVPSDESEIYPKKALLDNVREYLQKRALLTITEGIRVIGPRYQKVNIITEIVPTSVTEIAQVEEKCLRFLSNFLHPTKGGRDQKGWEFGSRILIADVVRILNSVENVVSIKKITVEKVQEGVVAETAYGSNQGWITLEADALPIAGNIQINITA